MAIVIFLVFACLSGFVLFRRNTIATSDESYSGDEKLSIIIPARNEEINLPHLLSSLQAQTYRPFEVIIVNDGSEDQTRAIAESYGIKVIESPSLPPGWTGKNWAVWNGYLNASGDILAFLDADVRLAPNALESLLNSRQKSGGVISVVPFHHTKQWYEKLALIPNILGMFAFTSPFERSNPKKGLYGSCILTTRADYEHVRGHDSVKSELLDDLNLGAKYSEMGIKVTNYIGCGLVSFRMYPNGIHSEIQGFGKGAVLSTSSLSLATIVLIAIWIAGLFISGSAVFFINSPLAYPLMFGYILYMLQIFYLVKYVGDFGKFLLVFHILSGLFFIFVLLYSVYQVAVLGRVTWKGRQIEVGGRKSL